MANRKFRNVHTLGVKTVMITGSFTGDGYTAATDTVDGYGYGWSVEKTDANTWTVTLEDTYYDLIYAHATVNPEDSTSALYAVVDTIGDSDNNTFIIYTKTVVDGALAAIDTADSISFMVVCLNSNVGRS